MGVWRSADGWNDRFGGAYTVATADRSWPLAVIGNNRPRAQVLQYLLHTAHRPALAAWREFFDDLLGGVAGVTLQYGANIPAQLISG
jgi:hypothetical protein